MTKLKDLLKPFWDKHRITNPRIKCICKSKYIESSDFEVKPSTIKGAGDGLFATRELPKGTHVPLDFRVAKCNDFLMFDQIPIIDDRIDMEKLTEEYNNYLRVSEEHASVVSLLKATPKTNHIQIKSSNSLAVLTRDVHAGEELFRTYGIEWFAQILIAMELDGFDEDMISQVIAFVTNQTIHINKVAEFSMMINYHINH